MIHNSLKNSFILIAQQCLLALLASVLRVPDDASVFEGSTMFRKGICIIEQHRSRDRDTMLRV
jgi:hypothetical protein